MFISKKSKSWGGEGKGEQCKTGACQMFFLREKNNKKTSWLKYFPFLNSFNLYEIRVQFIPRLQLFNL